MIPDSPGIAALKLDISSHYRTDWTTVRKLADDEGEAEDEDGEDSQDDEDWVVHFQVDVIHPLLIFHAAI